MTRESNFKGQPARLFPFYKDNETERRLVSVFLRLCELIPDVAKIVAERADVSNAKSKLKKIKVDIEPTFDGTDDKPDALIQIASKYILVEAKIGDNKIDGAQIESYRNIAKTSKFHVILTISNELTSDPNDNPSKIKWRTDSTVKLRHVSWSHIRTEIHKILKKDAEKSETISYFILQDFLNFLSNPNASGVKGFTQMNEDWPKLCKSSSKDKLNQNIYEKCIEDWFQEERELCLILMQSFEYEFYDLDVTIDKKRRQTKKDRLQEFSERLKNNSEIISNLKIPDASSKMTIIVNTKENTIAVSMDVTISEPKTIAGQIGKLKSTYQNLSDSARSILDNTKIRASSSSSASCDFDDIFAKKWKKKLGDKKVKTFTIEYREEISRNKFRSRKKFISALEKCVLSFYEHIGQKLKNDKNPAPKVMA